MGAEPTCSCTQLGHLADSPKNKVNSEQDLSQYEAWKPKCAEDALKQAVRRFYWPTGKVSGPDSGDLGYHKDIRGEPDQ